MALHIVNNLEYIFNLFQGFKIFYFTPDAHWNHLLSETGTHGEQINLIYTI